VSLSYKKQNSIVLSTVEIEYIIVGKCCAQLFWMKQTLWDFSYNLSKVTLLCDIESAIRSVDNPNKHIHTKHIHFQHHFLRDHQQRGDVDICHVTY
jgi:hypothetical protein